MEDISGFGLSVSIFASTIFPAGFTINQFADDADPFDAAAIDIADKAMGLNGDLITWSKATPLSAVFNVIPGSSDDNNLQVLFEANRVGKRKRGTRDKITVTVRYPDGSTDTYAGGKPMNFMPGKSVASAGRMKSKPYAFAFENRVAT